MLAATLNALPGVRTGRRRRPRRRPDKLHADKSYDHRRCLGLARPLPPTDHPLRATRRPASRLHDPRLCPRLPGTDQTVLSLILCLMPPLDARRSPVPPTILRAAVGALDAAVVLHGLLGYEVPVRAGDGAEPGQGHGSVRTLFAPTCAISLLPACVRNYAPASGLTCAGGTPLQAPSASATA